MNVTTTPDVTVHDLCGTDTEGGGGADASTQRSVANTLRAAKSVQLLVLGDTALSRIDGECLLRGLADRGCPVAAVALGSVRGAALAAFTAADLRLATRDASFAWGDTAVVPGLAAILAARCGWPVATTLAWGEVLDADGALAAGLTHHEVADRFAALEYVSARVARVGATTLHHRTRSLRAWNVTRNLAEVMSYDRHLALIDEAAGDVS